MNKTDIRRIIKEEISQIIAENQPKFKPGDHFKYMGTDHEVLEDNGFIVTALTKHGDKIKLNHNQLKNIFTENQLKENLPEPGKYIVEYTKERRNSFDESIVKVTENDIEKAKREGISGRRYWMEAIENLDPFFTSGDSIINVTRINDKINEFGTPTKVGIYKSISGKTFPQFIDKNKTYINVSGHDIVIKSENNIPRKQEDIERDIRLASIR